MSDERQILNKAEALDRVGDDQELYNEILSLYLEDSPAQLSILQDGLDSLDIALVERQAHSLKSASANIGAEFLENLAQEMEKSAREKNLAGVPETLVKFRIELDRLIEYLMDT